MAESDRTPVPPILSLDSRAANAFLIRLAWVAGFIEGEGSFSFNKNAGTQLNVSQVQRAPLDWLQSMFPGRCRLEPRKEPRQAIWRWSLNGRHAIGLMMALYPFMSPKRRAQIKRALDGWRAQPTAPRYWTACPRGHSNFRMGLARSGRPTRFCRDCCIAAVRAWQKRNPDRVREYRARSRERHRLSQK
jgi:hypothetical protein